MIESLQVKNVALIDEMDVCFHNGLNILTGETGAGKSIIIDSIGFVLGERAGKEFIRYGEDTAQVTCAFSVSDDRVRNSVTDMGIDIDDDNLLLLYRSITQQGKSVCRINGKTVTVGMLKEVSSMLVDLHGQHEHQSLLNQQKHIELLDKFCGEEMDVLKASLSDKIRVYREVLRSLKNLFGDSTDRESKIEALVFQTEEIRSANIKEGEEERLYERKKILNNIGRLASVSKEVIELLFEGCDGDLSAHDKISRSLGLLDQVTQLDPAQSHFIDELYDVSARLEDIGRSLNRYHGTLEYNPIELEEIEYRLDLIYRLKKKYGGSVSQVLDFYEKRTKELELMQNSDDEIKKLNADKRRIGIEILDICKRMSVIRREQADIITARIENVLKDLGMKDAKLEVSMEKKNEFSANGYDNVEFLISANAGEAVKPLAKIASGGEMSRIMLALKTVLADADNIGTFIFDEIDAGVSGRTAQQVAEKLDIIGRSRQILCITHLPQIAAMSDYHYLIEKRTVCERTTSGIRELDAKAAVKELARLIGGATITDATIEAAEDMKRQASLIKSVGYQGT